MCHHINTSESTALCPFNSLPLQLSVSSTLWLADSPAHRLRFPRPVYTGGNVREKHDIRAAFHHQRRHVVAVEEVFGCVQRLARDLSPLLANPKVYDRSHFHIKQHFVYKDPAA